MSPAPTSAQSRASLCPLARSIVQVNFQGLWDWSHCTLSGQLVAEFNCSHWVFSTSVIGYFLLPSCWNFLGCNLWLFPRACWLCTCEKGLIPSLLKLPMHVSRFACVICECDLILTNLSSFRFFLVWLAQLSLCWGLMTEMCRKFETKHFVTCFVFDLFLKKFWEALEIQVKFPILSSEEQCYCSTAAEGIEHVEYSLTYFPLFELQINELEKSS